MLMILNPQLLMLGYLNKVIRASDDNQSDFHFLQGDKNLSHLLRLLRLLDDPQHLAELPEPLLQVHFEEQAELRQTLRAHGQACLVRPQIHDALLLEAVAELENMEHLVDAGRDDGDEGFGVSPVVHARRADSLSGVAGALHLLGCDSLGGEDSVDQSNQDLVELVLDAVEVLEDIVTKQHIGGSLVLVFQKCSGIGKVDEALVLPGVVLHLVAHRQLVFLVGEENLVGEEVCQHDLHLLLESQGRLLS